MTFSDRLKIWKRNWARNGLYATSFVINRLPYSVVSGITSALIAVGYCFVIRQRRLAFESLQIAFGKEKSPEEIRKIAKNCFDNIGHSMIELIYFMAHPELITQKTVIEGKEHLLRALAQGKGVIAVSAHFGNFPLMLLNFARLGYKISAIIRPARDQEIEKYFVQMRTKLGLQTIYSLPRKTCVDTSLKVLRNNEILFIPLDQNFGSGGGVFVDFFGQKAATATGPVVFSRRTKAPILPMFVVREKGDVHKVIIEAPLEITEGSNDEETLRLNTQKITSLIEKYIRKYPQEWGWMHRRWKTKPQQLQ